MIRRLMRSVIACFCVSLLVLAPSANADMRGVDVSNWQCNIDTGKLNADFVVAGITWGVGGFNNTCLRNGVSQVADYQLVRATGTGKSIGVYHYAMGNDARREADFFVDHVTKYVGRAVLALDWEHDDNPQFGNGSWVDRWVKRVYERTRVWPVIYTPASALWQLSPYVRRHCGVWVAQYASNTVTGWQSRPWRYGAYGEAMRQYTGNGRIAGYAGAIDLDYFRGARWQWNAYAIGERKRPNKRPNKHNVSTAPVRTHTVRAGECLWSIFGSKWPRVAKINKISRPYLIYPGQVLRY